MVPVLVPKVDEEVLETSEEVLMVLEQGSRVS